jgi:hypothetical protein
VKNARSALTVAITACASGTVAGSVIYGLEFGRPITLADCPLNQALTRIDQRKTYEVLADAHCQKDPEKVGDEPVPAVEINWPRNNWPLGMKWGRAYAIVLDGALAGFHFQTNGAGSQDFMMEQLTEKYGKPTAVSHDRVQNLAGAAFDSITATWRGADVDVTFYGTFRTLDRGDVYIDYPAVTRLRDEYVRSRLGPKM